MDRRVLPKETPTQLLYSILQQKHHFLEICQSLLDDRKRRRLKVVEVFGDQRLANGEV
jgi:hypothetical protein